MALLVVRACSVWLGWRYGAPLLSVKRGEREDEATRGNARTLLAIGIDTADEQARARAPHECLCNLLKDWRELLAHRAVPRVQADEPRALVRIVEVGVGQLDRGGLRRAAALRDRAQRRAEERERTQ